MACHLNGTKPSSEPILEYCKLDPWEEIPMKSELKYKNFHSRKCIWKCRLQKWRPSCLGLNVLTPMLFKLECFGITQSMLLGYQVITNHGVDFWNRTKFWLYTVIPNSFPNFIQACSLGFYLSCAIIGSDSGLEPLGNKPLPEPVLIKTLMPCSVNSSHWVKLLDRLQLSGCILPSGIKISQNSKSDLEMTIDK